MSALGGDPLPDTLTDCCVCGLPAEVIDAFTIDSTSGPVDHHRIRCIERSHLYWQWQARSV